MPARDPVTNRFLPKSAAKLAAEAEGQKAIKEAAKEIQKADAKLPAGQVHADPDKQAAHDRLKAAMKASPAALVPIAAVTGEDEGVAETPELTVEAVEAVEAPTVWPRHPKHPPVRPLRRP